VSTVRFALVVLLLAGAFTLYVGHVHATTDVLDQLQEARSENQRLHLKRNRLKGAYDRKTSPKVIHERAREMGMEASVTYGPPITIDE
jgi:cell division protein FtsB